MDSYREILGECFRPDADGSDHVHGLSYQPSPDDSEDVGCEPLPASVGQDERRMQVRAYNFWSGLLDDQPFPRFQELTAGAPPDFADNALVLDFSDGIDNPAVTMLGEKLAQQCGADRTIERMSDVPARSLLSRLTDHYMQVLANRAPIGFEAEFIDQRGKTMAYRGILLPFSSDGETIVQMMGVINWKELADPAITAALIGELGENAGRGDARSSLSRLTAWADGPVIDDRLDIEASQQAEWGLADWLVSARELARQAIASEDRSRAALYAAIGRAWDFALAADADPQGYTGIVAAAGLKVQDRAPMTPVVKLVFGVAYDKTRLAEFATALAQARRLGLERGRLADFLAATPGGLKEVIRMERNWRRAGGGIAAHDKLAGKLREQPTRSLRDICAEGSEFALVLIRRLPGRRPCLLGEVDASAGLIDRAARHLLR